MKRVYIDLNGLMEFSGYSTTDICRGAKVSSSTIDRILKNKMRRIPMKTLGKLIKFFRCDIEDIIKIKEE